MIRVDDSDSPNGNGKANYTMFRISKAEVEEAWCAVTREHLPPSRLISLGFGSESPTDAEQDHLKECQSCRDYYRAYATSSETSHDSNRSVPTEPEFTLPLSRTELPYHSDAHIRCACNDEDVPSVPSLLKKHLYVSGPILFPDQEVAFHSWQFGQLKTIERDNECIADQIVEAIARRAFNVIEPTLGSDNILLVCFGNAMHRCGIRLATMCEAAGLVCPHVVLSHDYYSPTFVCNPDEFTGATVFVLVDVVHTGQLLNRIIDACLDLGPRRLVGLAVIDQSEGRRLSVSWHALWKEHREARLSLKTFRQSATADEFGQLQRFEPNEECGVASESITCPKAASPLDNEHPVAPKIELLHYIHITGALKRDYSISGKRYPYVVNVLDLLKKDASSREFILAAARTELADLMSQKVCLAYHAGRSSRAGVIAGMLGTEMQWRTIPIGRSGTAFSLTDKQYQMLRCFNTVVVVDAAIRTGESTSAMMQALSDPWLRERTRFIAFFVLDALSEHSREDLSSELGVEIRTLFGLPMSPPTEEIRHWAKTQKSLVLQELQGDPRFERVHQALGNYCDPPTGVPHPSSSSESIEDTSRRLKEALDHAHLRNKGKAQVYVACREHKPHLIRHLSLNEVVHDRSVQDLLIGVMYNSMKPSFKESAALALAAARNYDWMTLDWLKCNKPFLTSSTNAWKAVLLIECEMRLNGRTKELTQFRDAAFAVLSSYEQPVSPKNESVQLRLSFSRNDDDERCGVQDIRSHEESLQRRLSERLNSFVDAAG